MYSHFVREKKLCCHVLAYISCEECLIYFVANFVAEFSLTKSSWINKRLLKIYLSNTAIKFSRDYCVSIKANNYIEEIRSRILQIRLNFSLFISPIPHSKTKPTSIQSSLRSILNSRWNAPVAGLFWQPRSSCFSLSF